MYPLALVRNMFRASAALLAGCSLLTISSSSVRADLGTQKQNSSKARMVINAGTAFNLTPAPAFPWHHEVRGVVQVSNLGNATVRFAVQIDGGNACAGGHLFCLSGKMTITTLAGDELEADVVGWADPDPNDPNATPSMYLLHYDATITGGSGGLQGASGTGEINGAFNFCGGDCFCDSYAGIATWLYDGILHLPKK
jgi:hypothetical protein